MEIEKEIEFLNKEVTNNGLYRYDFLDLETNLPFTVYGANSINAYEKLEKYKVTKLKFNLLLCKSNNGLGWKVKGV